MPDTTISTQSTNFDKQLTVLVKRTLEEEFRKDLPWVRECIPAKFLAGSNNTLRYLRVEDMDVVTGTPTPGVSPWLSEGVTPDGEDLDLGYEEFSAAQAGRLLKMTDVSTERWAEGNLTAVATEKVTRNAAATADQRVADVVIAGDQKAYASGDHSTVGTLDNTDIVTGKILRKTAAGMKLDLIPRFGDATYHAIISPGVVFDIEGDEAVGGWLDANKYAGPEKLLSGEIGKYAGIRFIESASAVVLAGQGAGSLDVYCTTVFGPSAFVFGDWGTIEVYYTAPGGKGDELHQRSAVGWKSNYGAMIVGEGDNATNMVPARYVNLFSTSGV